MTGRSKEETADITLLGNQKTQYPCDYAPEMLETFENKHQGNDYFVKFNCPEFTSLCPITGQPDFATVTISSVAKSGCPVIGHKLVNSGQLNFTK